MKFAKVLEQTLIEEDIPEEWVEAAIQYKSLKKCINKVVRELQFLGLEQNTLKLLLEDPSNEKVVELNENETTPTNPIIAEYTITKSKNDQGNSQCITPILKISLNYENDDFTDDHIYELGQELKQKIEGILNNDDDYDDEIADGQDTNHHKFMEIKEEGDSLVLSPQTSSSVKSRLNSPPLLPSNSINQVLQDDVNEGKTSISTPSQLCSPRTSSPTPRKRKTNEIYIMLNSDAKFFHMLNKELENLDDLKSSEESKLLKEVEIIGDTVRTLSSPNISVKKSDLYKWRELFKIYLDSEVYFKYNEIKGSASEKNGDQIKKNLQQFIQRVNKSGVLNTFKSKRSTQAFDQFINMNFHLLKVLQFQSINSTAFTKILKKFDKQTSLGVKKTFPKLISDDHIFFAGASLAQSICYVIQNSVLTLIPQLDDYTCPICTSVAFKPIKLECGHVFCVRCLVKLKQQNKSNCPICRYEQAVIKADSTNLDVDSMILMKAYFPLEVREKLKERGKERYDEVVGKNKCIIV